MRFLVSSLALALAMTLGAVAHSPEPAAAAGYKPAPGGHFNIPRSSLENQRRIESVILSAIRHARKGSTIQVAIYSFDQKHMARALIDAHRRGVNVRVLLNDHQYTGAMRMMRSAFGADRSRRSFVYVCDSGCRSYTENLHTKMYLFSHTGRARHVVMTGSVNLTLNATKNQWNDMWVKNDNKALYDKFTSVFQEMQRDRPAKPAYRSMAVGDRFRIRVLPFLGSRDRDPIVRILNGVRCTGARTRHSDNGRTLVRVSMHAWHTERGVYLAKKLRNMYGNGCDVRLLYGMAGQAVKDVLARRTARGFVPVRSDGFDTDGDGYIDQYSHHKYLVISGNHDGNRRANLVVTGSSNYADNGLSGDELIFSAVGSGYVGQWKRNHDYVWRNGSRSVAYIPRSGASTRIMLADPKPGGPAWEND